MNLTHHFLIAMPGLEDKAFSRSVVYLCEHSERGALGLVINRPTERSLGAGEASQGPTVAAIANAFAHATSRRLRDLPFSSARVKAALG